MFEDCRGLALTTTSEQAAVAFDHAVDGYLGYRADMAARMDALLAIDPDFGMAHCLKGYLFMMSFRADTVAGGRGRPRRIPGDATSRDRREHDHAEAPWMHWVAGDPEQAVAVWNQILRDHPLDILAFRLAHFVNFWLGRPEAMLASVLSVERSLESGACPATARMLACRCFAHEEMRILPGSRAGRP